MLNISLGYKSDGRLSTATLPMTKEMLSFLNVSDSNDEILLEYKEKKIILMKHNSTIDCFEQLKNKDVVFYYKKNIKLIFYKKGNSVKLNIPLSILNDFGITKDNRNIKYEFEGDKMIISKDEKENRNGKIFMSKINKGGVGKTFITSQLASGLAEKEYKVLIITSDDQNNIWQHLSKRVKGEKPLLEFNNGLKYSVENLNDDHAIRMRKNLFFIPLEDETFGNKFFNNINEFLSKMREKYDFIFIDSPPTLKKIDTVDMELMNLTDKFIIPCYCIDDTVQGAINIIQKVGVDKVLSLVVNKYSARSTEKKYLKILDDNIKGSNIFYPEPIPLSTLIMDIIDKGKTIWETKTKELDTIREIFNSIMDTIIDYKNGKEEVYDELDF
jgi:chromosome partitioning protein